MISIERHGTIEAFQPTGPLKAELLDELREVVDLTIVQGRPTIILDLEKTLLLDSEALEWLLGVDECCARRGGNLSLIGNNEVVQDILNVTGVGNQLLQFDDLTEALGALAQ